VEWRRPRGPDGAPLGLPASQYERIVVKVYDTRQAANRGWAVLEGVWLTQQGTRHAFRVPRPLHFERELLSVWSTHVPGLRLAAHPEAWNTRTAGRIGRGLAALHQARMHLPESLHLDDEAALLRHHAGLIARAYPEVAGRLDALLDLVTRCLPGLSRLPLVASHGSFNVNHLLADGERIAVVDFDRMVNADPVFDLANLAAELEYFAVQGLLSAARASELEVACRDAYLAHVPWPARHAVLDWCVACLLVRKQAYKCVKLLHTDASQKALALIDAATRRLRRHDP
jgi:Ser/Thr protein kinase RdoA (MazF antagonist)